jgi:hypothetical protein
MDVLYIYNFALRFNENVSDKNTRLAPVYDAGLHVAPSDLG